MVGYRHIIKVGFLFLKDIILKKQETFLAIKPHCIVVVKIKKAPGLYPKAFNKTFL
jgi:hypothetical protein